ncbi:hypothetical protein pdam_00024406 [Pocillopora damicornis]|uniref:Peptidase A2 domain-containing protein n=1 Tax=Pocillopora damicornis TaxID=46731 RepID=A0A3M6UAG1_POCDA|nr:hypothetical protein pdam_00024406 [Pocillopora damicornis]
MRCGSTLENHLRLKCPARDDTEEVKVNGVTIKFKLDTGADVTKAHKKLFGPCKSKLHCLDIIKAKLRLNGNSRDEDVYVVEHLETPLPERWACLALGTVATVGTVTQSADDIKARFPRFLVAWSVWRENTRLN